MLQSENKMMKILCGFRFRLNLSVHIAIVTSYTSTEAIPVLLRYKCAFKFSHKLVLNAKTTYTENLIFH